MNRNNLLAFIVWAIDTDRLSYPVAEAWDKFKQDAVSMLKTYTDPTDECLYCSKLVGSDPIEFFTDYILMYAKWAIEADRTSTTPCGRGALYGKYEEDILNYNHKPIAA